MDGNRRFLPFFLVAKIYLVTLTKNLTSERLLSIMLIIDNKHNYPIDSSKPKPKSEDILTIAQYLKTKIGNDNSNGDLSLVSGYYSIEAFHSLLPQLQNLNNLQMILGHISGQQNQILSQKSAITKDRLSIANSLKFVTQISQVVKLLESDKVKIKTRAPDFCHAKAYIYKSLSSSPVDPKDFGIIGSSNLTSAGIGLSDNGNIELNNVFDGNDGNTDQLKDWFETNYKLAKDNKQEVIDEIKNYYKTEYTPEDIYSFTLYTLFQKDLEDSQSILDQINENKNLQESIIWNKLYEFQQKGVISLIKKLEKYNFALLGDGVGLGKTYQTLAVIKYYLSKGSKILVISPKKLSDNWTKYKYEHQDEGAVFYDDELNFDFKSLSQLFHNYDNDGNVILSKNKLDNYDLVIIDESHNLRNSSSNKYQFLVEQIIQGRKNSKVILLSATPLNNEVKDVRNQFQLGFSHPDNNFKNYFDFELANVFKNVQETINKAQKSKLSVDQIITKISQETKFLELIDTLCVARTRNIITKFYPDSNIKFPKARLEWKPLEYFESAVDILMDGKTANSKPKIKFNIYKVAQYVKDKNNENSSESQEKRENSLAKMMMINLIKRLESSFYAFDKTLTKIIRYHDYILKLDDIYTKIKDQKTITQNDTIGLLEDMRITSKELDRDIDEDEMDAQMDDLLGDMQGASKTIKDQLRRFEKDITLIKNGYLIGSKKPVNIKELGSTRSIFINNIKTEKAKLEAIKAQMIEEYGFDAEDHKILKLRTTIKAILNNNRNRKILIFTTYSDTANYIYNNIQDLVSDEYKLAMVTGTNGKNTDQILKRFSPQSMIHNELSKTEKDKYEDYEDFWSQYNGQEKTTPIQILVATDCISEGQNLQDCDCLINFDIHWNPVRLVQRNGRIDRIGSKFDTVDIINFLPGKSLENVLQLKSRLDYKMALVGMVGGVDGDEMNTQKTAMIEFWHNWAKQNNRDLNTLDEDEVKQIIKTNISSDKTQIDQYCDAVKQITSGGIGDYRELQMLKMMENSYEDIEDNQLGINSFSLDKFREELELDIKKRSGITAYPNGIFGGCVRIPDSKGNAQKGTIILLKTNQKLTDLENSNRQKTNSKHPYFMYFVDFNGQIIKKYMDLPLILEILKQHKFQPSHIPAELDPSDNLQKYENLIKIAIDNYKIDSSNKEATGLFSGGQLSTNNKNTTEIEDENKYEDYEIITWLIIC